MSLSLARCLPFMCTDLPNFRADLPSRIERHKGAISVIEMAEYLGKRKSTLYQMCTDGRIPHYRIDGAICFDPYIVAEWLRGKAIPVAA
jgi:excisionase family DNA binding protein